MKKENVVKENIQEHTSFATFSNENDNISLKEVIWKVYVGLKYILSKWIIILAAGLIGGGIGLLYVIKQKPIYHAELSFVLADEESNGTAGYAGLASQFGLSIGGGGGGAFSGDNLIELMKSRSLVTKALLTPIYIDAKHETLAEYYLNFNKIRKSWGNDSKLKGIKFLPNSDPERFSRQQDSVLGNIYKTITSSQLTVDRKDKELSIILVKVKSKDELFSKIFAEVLVKEVTDFYVKTKTKKSAQNLAVLQRQTDSVRNSLNRAISGVAISADLYPNANPARRVLAVPSKRKEIDVQANQAILTELVKNLEVTKMSLRRETPFIQIIDTPILPLQVEVLGKRKGVVIGGIVASLIATIYLLLRKFISDYLI